jgi:hypothetical protein
LDASQRIPCQLRKRAKQKYDQHRGRQGKQNQRANRHSNRHIIARFAMVWR